MKLTPGFCGILVLIFFQTIQRGNSDCTQATGWFNIFIRYLKIVIKDMVFFHAEMMQFTIKSQLCKQIKRKNLSNVWELLKF